MGQRKYTILQAITKALGAVLESRLADVLTAITPIVKKSIGAVKVQPAGDATFVIKVVNNSVKGTEVIRYKVRITATRLS
jgi:hypothetical protein